MIEKKIQIINDCLANSSKINLYLSFNDKEVTKEPSLVLRKYYLWQLKFNLKVNIPVGAEGKYFIELLRESNDSDSIIAANYCLGEICINNNLLDKAAEYFEKVISESEKYNKNDLIVWAERNLIDMNKYIDRIVSYKVDILSFESNYWVFCYFEYKRESVRDENLFNKAAYLLAMNCPSYKNVGKLVCNYYSSRGEWNNLLKCSVEAYKKTNEKEYITSIVLSLEMSKSLDCNDYNKVLEILNQLLASMQVTEWANLIHVLYYATEKSNLERLLLHICNALKYAQLFTGELKGLHNLTDVLKSMYIDIIKYRSKYEFIEAYEKDITKYLLYVSNQNGATAEVYESYTKLKAYENCNLDVITAFAYMDDPKLENIDKLQRIKNYPYAELLKELKIILEGVKLDSKSLDNVYLKNQNSQCKIMLYGIFSSGKSAFINSLLGADLLEEGDLPTTSTFTFVACDLNSNLEEVVQYTLPINKVIVNDEFLKENNIILIDTPGFEDSDLERAELSSDNIDMCDGFIIFLDATKPLTASEFKKIKNLKEKTPHGKFLFIVNKIDFLNEEEDELADIMQYIKRKLAKIFTEEVNIYPYSSYMVKKGNKALKEDIYVAIKKVIPNDEAQTRWQSISDAISFEKKRIENEFNKRALLINKDISYLEEIIAKLKVSENLMQKVLEDYKNKLKNDIEQLENRINKYMEDNIKGIFNKNLNNVSKYENVNTIYSDVIIDLKQMINLWGKSEYNLFVSKEVRLFLKNTNDFIIDKNNLLNGLISDIREICKGYYVINKMEFSKDIETYNLIAQLSNNCAILLKKTVIDVDMVKAGLGMVYNFESFKMGIEEPALGGLSRGFSKFFNGEAETLVNYRKQIHNQSESAIKNTILHIIDNPGYLNYVLSMIKNLLYEGQEKFDTYKKNELLKEGCSTEIIYKNTDIIKDHLKNIRYVEGYLETKIVEKQLEVQKQYKSGQCTLNKINNLIVELRKYKNQIARGVVYDNGELYRTN